MLTEEFDFNLPPSLIAQFPAEPRDSSRLLVVDRAAGGWSHHTFREFSTFLRPGDLLVRNNSRVIPARLMGTREATGGRWEGLYLQTIEPGLWEIMGKTRGRPRPGERIVLHGGVTLELARMAADGTWTARVDTTEPAAVVLRRIGSVPLPPYIRRGVEGPGDRERYQTLYAAADGSVAAPTAGLHFTAATFAALDARGVRWVDVTLHVGIGTFRPIVAERIEDHQLHAEWAEVTADAAERMNATRAQGGRVVAVGTTSARVLETAARSGRGFEPFEGETARYLRPGMVFQGMDALLTNFHLPRSSLLVLVSAFGGLELIRAAYAEAIREQYRFYSYGDAMLVL